MAVCHLVSISTEMPGPWRRIGWREESEEWVVSISTEMPGPWRPIVWLARRSSMESFNLNRDARPLATRSEMSSRLNGIVVSISTEMPGPWRLAAINILARLEDGFNLNRDARPLAT